MSQCSTVTPPSAGQGERHLNALTASCQAMLLPAHSVYSHKQLLHTYKGKTNAILHSIVKAMLQAYFGMLYLTRLRANSGSVSVSMALPAHAAIFMTCSHI